jgi:hypothetical protein
MLDPESLGDGNIDKLGMHRGPVFAQRYNRKLIMRQKTNFDIKTGFSKMQSYSAVYVCAMLLCAC